MMRVRKLKAGALQLTLFISVVIAILLTVFIILLHTQKQFKLQSSFVIETVKEANKGIHLANNNILKLNDTIIVDSENELNRLKIHRNFWGIYEKITAHSQIKKKRFTKVALIGAQQNELQQTALYLQDNKKPLVVVGNTYIQGQAYVPQLGVKPGTISGQSYYGEQLIYGSTSLSQQLPKLQSDLLRELEKLNRIDISQAEYWPPKLKRKVSFLEPLTILYSKHTINLSHAELSGHIVVKSDSKIIVDATSQLSDVILIAPEIEIKSHTISNFQAIATKQIKVGTNCMLNYPSALVLKEQKKIIQDRLPNTEKYTIEIADNSTVKGVIAFLGQPKEQNYEAQITISKSATLIGEVYCNQNLDLKGEVKGTVFTSNFVTKAFGSIYQNHLLNARISVNDLQNEYVGLLFNDSKKNVAKWLY